MAGSEYLPEPHLWGELSELELALEWFNLLSYEDRGDVLVKIASKRTLISVWREETELCLGLKFYTSVHLLDGHFVRNLKGHGGCVGDAVGSFS